MLVPGKVVFGGAELEVVEDIELVMRWLLVDNLYENEAIDFFAVEERVFATFRLVELDAMCDFDVVFIALN